MTRSASRLRRIGHAGVEAVLMLDGRELDADIDDAEAEIVAVAAGERTRQEFEGWVRDHAVDAGGQSG